MTYTPQQLEGRTRCVAMEEGTTMSNALHRIKGFDIWAIYRKVARENRYQVMLAGGCVIGEFHDIGTKARWQISIDDSRYTTRDAAAAAILNWYLTAT